MKKKRIISPLSEIYIALTLIMLLALGIRSCNNQTYKERIELIEMQQYHSNKGLVEVNEGYLNIIKY